jgi:hypothetical protein
MGRRRLHRFWLIMLAGLLVGTGCAPDEPAPVSTTPAPQYPSYDGTALAELGLDPVRLSPKLIMKEITRAAVLDDTMIMSGLDQDGSSAVASVDLQTGDPRWQGAKVADTVSVGSGEATVVTADGWAVEDGSGGLVIEQYYHLPCGDDPCSRSGTGYTPERGLIAFSASDRSVRWSEPILPKLRSTDPEAVEFANLTPMTVAATAQVIVVNLGGDSLHGTQPVPGSGPSRSIGYDPKTGKKLWTRDDVLTQQATDDALLAVEPGATEADTRLIALDPRTGKTRWRLADRAGSWSAAAGELGLAVLCGDSCTTRSNELVSVGGGSIVTESLPRSAAVGTDEDGTSLAAWATAGSGSRLVSQRASDATPATGADVVSENGTVKAAVGGYLWLWADDRVSAVDRTGARRSDQVRGRPAMVDETYLLVDGDRGPGISLYRWHSR